MKLFPLLAVAVVLSLTGCASISVKNVEKRAARVPAPPAVIYVADYDTGGGSWNITSISRKPEQYKAEVAEILAKELTADATAFLKIPTQRVGRSKAVPPNGWLVSGKFTRVSEGSPAGRIIIGLGVGSTKLETETTVTDGRVHGPILHFATTGGSNALPGMIFSSGPGSAVVTGVSQAMRGVSDDAKRTSRQITASLAEYELEKGWIKTSSLKVKKPGEYQLLQPLMRPATATSPAKLHQ
ncbi:MAG TPA: DUF4410 domain-containing protein [Chthoniobacteraceae bacterium]|jgi:hypothetical protein|nr:DUF4410 domain-containing protein [Chthoniobacteraceae bacterium]